MTGKTSPSGEQMNQTGEKKFEILLHEVNHRGVARLTSLCNFMQAAADFHSRSLGTSMAHLEEKGLTWVYARFRIQMARYPRCYETVSVRTWRSRIERALAFREFELKDQEGSLLAAATSAVALIDKKTRKPVPIPGEMSSQFSELPKSSLAGSFSRIDGSELKTSPPMNFPVLKQDIDINGHVNNVSYISWLIESLPEEVLEKQYCSFLEIHYRAEAFYGSPVRAEISRIEKQKAPAADFYHRLTQGESVTTEGLTRWDSL